MLDEDEDPERARLPDANARAQELARAEIAQLAEPPPADPVSDGPEPPPCRRCGGEAFAHVVWATNRELDGIEAEIAELRRLDAEELRLADARRDR